MVVPYSTWESDASLVVHVIVALDMLMPEAATADITELPCRPLGDCYVAAGAGGGDINAQSVRSYDLANGCGDCSRRRTRGDVKPDDRHFARSNRILIQTEDENPDSAEIVPLMAFLPALVAAEPVAVDTMLSDGENASRSAKLRRRQLPQ